MKKRLNLNRRNLPQRKLSKFLTRLDRHSLSIYRHVMKSLMRDLLKTMQKDKLAKSLGSGWTGEVPKIEINLSGKISTIIEEYMSAIRWALIGDHAGKDAKKAAKKIGLDKQVVPGILQSAYLKSIDSQIQFYEELFEKNASKIPDYLIKDSIERISDRFTRYMDGFVPQIKNALISAVEGVKNDLDNSNLNQAHKYAHKVLSEYDKEKDMPSLKEKFEDTMSAHKIRKELNKVTEKFEPNWERASKTEISLSSSVGVHQVMLETYGSEDDDVDVVFIVTEDERSCQWCNFVANHKDGTPKVYKLKDIKPSGYNIGRKRKDWKPSVAPMHPNCFDDKTEVLTKEGWKFFSEISGKEEFLSVNPNTGDADWIKANKKIEYHYHGVIHHFRSLYADFCTTPGHNHLIKFRKKQNGRKDVGKWVLIPGDQLPKNDFSFLATIPNWNGKQRGKITIGDEEFDSIDFVKFMGIYISKGSCFVKKDGCCVMSIHQEKHHDEFAEITRKIFGERTNSRKKGGKIDVYMKNKVFADMLMSLGKCHEKYVPEFIKEYDKKHLEEFWFWFVKGDGSIKTNSSFHGYESTTTLEASTSSKKLLSDLSEIVLKIGFRPSFRIQEPKWVQHKNGLYKSKHDQLVITACKNQNYSIKSTKKQEKQYNGMVYCVELEKFNTLITRRKGKTVVSGNCRCEIVYKPKGFEIDEDGMMFYSGDSED